MTVFALRKSTFGSTELKYDIGDTTCDFALACFLESVDPGTLYLYTVFEMFAGEDEDWPKAAWRIDEMINGQEWLDDFKSNSEANLLQVGMVVNASFFKMRKNQNPICMVTGVSFNRVSGGYMILKSLTRKSGKPSSDRKNTVYISLNKIHYLKLWEKHYRINGDFRRPSTTLSKNGDLTLCK